MHYNNFKLKTNRLDGHFQLKILNTFAIEILRQLLIIILFTTLFQSIPSLTNKTQFGYRICESFNRLRQSFIQILNHIND